MKKFLKIILPYIVVVILGAVALHLLFENKEYERNTIANEKEVADINKKHDEDKKKAEAKHKKSQDEITQLKKTNKIKTEKVEKAKKKYRAINVKEIRELNEGWQMKFELLNKECDRALSEKDEIIDQLESQVIGLQLTIKILDEDNLQYQKDSAEKDKTIFNLNRKLKDQFKLKPKKTSIFKKVLYVAGLVVIVAVIK